MRLPYPTAIQFLATHLFDTLSLVGALDSKAGTYAAFQDTNPRAS